MQTNLKNSRLKLRFLKKTKKNKNMNNKSKRAHKKEFWRKYSLVQRRESIKGVIDITPSTIKTLEKYNQLQKGVSNQLLRTPNNLSLDTK